MISNRIIGLLAAVAIVASLGAAPAAEAQMSYLVSVRAGVFQPTGTADSFDAVYGGDLVPQVGLGFEARFPKRMFIALAAEHGEVDGEHVIFTPDPEPTGVDTTLTLQPVHLTIGMYARAGDHLSFYGGVGPTLLRWEETNEFDSISASDAGLHLLGGVRWTGGHLAVSLEARWSTIPDAVGQGGASEFFGEDDLGGAAASLSAGWAF